MRTWVHDGTRALPGGRHQRAGKDWLVPTFVVLAIFAVVVAIALDGAAHRGGIRQLPEQRRAALFSRTVEELSQFCAQPRPGALDDHCRELARFAAQFDECRGACEALVHRELTPLPTR